MAGTIVANTLNTDTGLFSTQNAYQGIAKAWVFFNGTANTITNSFNVGSITKNGTGDYTINFTTAMPNASFVTTALSTTIGALYGSTQTTTFVRVAGYNSSFGLADSTAYGVAIFGN